MLLEIVVIILSILVVYNFFTRRDYSSAIRELNRRIDFLHEMIETMARRLG